MNRICKISTLYLLLFITIHSVAQNKDYINLRCHYITDFKYWDTNKRLSQDETILDIGKTSSEFYSLWERRIQEVTDSTLAHGGGLGDVMNAMEKTGYPRSHNYYTVYKNFPQQGVLTYTDKIFEPYLYEEPLEKPVWILLEETKTILDYRCQKAYTTFRGRKWFAWFTLEIPVSEGPWKLWGLPGLILEAQDGEEEFYFTCVAIRQLADPKPIELPKKKFIRCTKKQYFEAQEFSQRDSEGYLRQFGIDPPIHSQGPDGKPIQRPKRSLVQIEK